MSYHNLTEHKKSALQSNDHKIDPKYHRLRKVYLEPTTTCNLNCTTCLRNNWNESIGQMSHETFNKFITDIKEIETMETVAFWGIGEPLTNPHIHEMIKAVKDLGLKTEMISNAMRLDAPMAKKLVNAGLDKIIISVDSTLPEQLADIRSGAKLNSIIENVKLLNAEKQRQGKGYPEVGIEFCAMKKNIGQLKNLRELAYLMEASIIIVTNFLPYSEEDKDQILYWYAATSRHEKKRSKRNPQISLPRIDINPDTVDHLGKISVEAMTYSEKPLSTNDYAGICPFVERGAIAITRTGDVSPCIPLMHSYTCYVLGDKKEMVKYAISNINDEHIRDIWNRQEYKTLRHKLVDDQFAPCVECGRCEFADSNLEDCLGNTHPTCGDCLWAKGIIQCP